MLCHTSKLESWHVAIAKMARVMVATKEGCAMLKKYIVRLTDEERETLKRVVGKFNGTSQ